MKKLLLPTMLLISQLILAQHQNIKISRLNNPQEPTICINTSNTQNIVAGANANKLFYSNDGGLTWENDILTSSHGVAGDPCIINDKYGNFYYFHLSNPMSGSWLDRIVCQKSTDNGTVWNDGSYMGLTSPKDQDKEWATVDFKNNNIYTTWTQFDLYGSTSSTKKSNILFSMSEDNGESWSTAIQINEFSGNCIDSDNTTEGAVPAVGPNGEIYVAWSYNEKIYFDKSLDQGKTWLDNDIEVSSQLGGWDYDIPGIMRCNGLPVTCCDTSNSRYKGTIYVNWTDQSNGGNDTDVWLCKSSDGGNTWSKKIRVNDDTTKTHQFLTWMTIDQTNGNLYFVFYDRRNYTDNTTDVYIAVSKNGGASFTNFKISEKPFLPRNDVFFGDYNNITAHNNVIRPIWTRLHYDAVESGLSIWTSIIDIDLIGVDIKNIFPVAEDIIYPNPANHLSFYSFKIRKRAKVSLNLYDSYGRVVKNLINNEVLSVGKYIKEVNLEEENLVPGLYFYVLSHGDEYRTKKLVVVN